MGEWSEWAILCWESGTFRFLFHLVSERFNCSKWLTPAHQRDRDGGRVTERMTLMDKKRGERGKESDRDWVKDIVREFNGEREGSVLSFSCWCECLCPLKCDGDGTISLWHDTAARSTLEGPRTSSSLPGQRWTTAVSSCALLCPDTHTECVQERLVGAETADQRAARQNPWLDNSECNRNLQKETYCLATLMSPLKFLNNFENALVEPHRWEI